MKKIILKRKIRNNVLKGAEILLEWEHLSAKLWLAIQNEDDEKVASQYFDKLEELRKIQEDVTNEMYYLISVLTGSRKSAEKALTEQGMEKVFEEHGIKLPRLSARRKRKVFRKVIKETRNLEEM